jgi:hypothetical protein
MHSSIDILKMEQSFYVGYRKGDKVLYVSTTNWQGHEESFHDHEDY